MHEAFRGIATRLVVTSRSVSASSVEYEDFDDVGALTDSLGSCATAEEHSTSHGAEAFVNRANRKCIVIPELLTSEVMGILFLLLGLANIVFPYLLILCRNLLSFSFSTPHQPICGTGDLSVDHLTSAGDK